MLNARADEDIGEILASVRDIERIVARVALKSARPRDLVIRAPSLSIIIFRPASVFLGRSCIGLNCIPQADAQR
jgi:hypothetical protein